MFWYKKLKKWCRFYDLMRFWDYECLFVRITGIGNLCIYHPQFLLFLGKFIPIGLLWGKKDEKSCDVDRSEGRFRITYFNSYVYQLVIESFYWSTSGTRVLSSTELLLTKVAQYIAYTTYSILYIQTCEVKKLKMKEYSWKSLWPGGWQDRGRFVSWYYFISSSSSSAWQATNSNLPTTASSLFLIPPKK